MRFLRAVMVMCVLGALTVVFTALYALDFYLAPGPMTQETTVLFNRGAGFNDIVDELADKGVIEHPLIFKVLAVTLGQARNFKAGEYDFPALITPQAVMDMIAHGKVVIHKVTVPEGWEVREVVALLRNEPALDGALPDDIREGSLMPETYHFTRGDRRAEVLARMQASMSAYLDERWAKRKQGLPFDTKEQALILASIVEKETGVKSERGRVAAVFINRLRLGMKLQTDPTVAYGIEKKNNAPMIRALTLADLQSDTPYNTYVIAGLPPGPIANPGRDAIDAVMNPPDTKELYFVATGNGGHNFASTLEEHNRNVQKYRRVMKNN